MAEQEQAQTYDVDTIARLLDLTPRRVQQLASDGYIPRASRGRYHLVSAVQGYIRYLRACANDEATSADYERERARLTKMKADTAELENGRLQGKLVDIDAVIDGVQQANARVRNQVLSLPQRIAPKAATETDITAIHEQVQEVVTDILAEMSDPHGVCREAQKRGDVGAPD